MTYLDILEIQGASALSSYGATLASQRGGDPANLNHHLWNNRGTWWCHFTLHHPNYTSERVRVSLRTREVEVARRRRDELLARFASDC